MHTILVPIDFSDSTPGVIDTASEMAGTFDARLHLLHVVMPEVFMSSAEFGALVVRSELASRLRQEHRELRNLESTLKCQGLEVTAALREGSPVFEILDEAKRLDPKLIIVGSHGHGALHKLLLGSVSAGVLRKSKCPVLIVPVRQLVTSSESYARREPWANEAEA